MVQRRCKRGSAAPTANPQKMSKPTQEQVEFTIFRHNLQPHPIGSFYQPDYRSVSLEINGGHIYLQKHN